MRGWHEQIVRRHIASALYDH